eukprot:gnl/MRDRNA2_/MRDRNA2_29907_c0_seq1.p1 gnl/MRDRNA2_/MRDRNA2_29907_c0~~gnl/MRDRNA2_/MRDRNA2_29907_c0_seq1.p1  ORF type:complete len:169 (-),score=73.24 gnl/MRDRNA2_/MRDRNA2_29907_c0_seq1:365-871(-)
MKPDWDKLAEEYKDSKTAGVFDVDCTTAGKALCEQHGVRGYPTIKWGDPSNLEDYKGGRSLKDLQKFAAENLKPICSPSNLDLCDDEKKAEIKKFQDMSDADLEAAIAAKKKEIEAAEEAFNTGLKGLQETYEKLQKDKDDGIKAIKDSGLGLMQAVAAAGGKPKEEL